MKNTFLKTGALALLALSQPLMAAEPVKHLEFKEGETFQEKGDWWSAEKSYLKVAGSLKLDPLAFEANRRAAYCRMKVKNWFIFAGAAFAP